MSKPLMQLFVLISCPADLATERQVVEAAVAETNTVLTKTHGVVLTAISWEKDLLPGIGPDAQSVINSQIEGRYDIYIGLLGARFGSETPRAGSGTEEEFNQAYKRYAAAPETVRVLFYFKNTADNVHRLDLEQLAKVIKFRKKLSVTALSYEFTTPDVLLKMIKDHLFRLVAEQWDGRNWKVLTPLPQATQANQLPPGVSRTSQQIKNMSEALEGEEPNEENAEEERTSAILDAIVFGEAGLQTAIESLNKMAGLMNVLTSKINAQAAGMKTPVDARAMKAVIDRVADDLDDYSKGLKKETSIFKASLNDALNGLDSAIRLYFEERLGEPRELRAVPQQLATLIDGIRTGRVSVDQFRETIEGLPGFTVKFKKSQRTANRLLADLVAALTVFLDRAESIQRVTSEHVSSNANQEGT